MIGNFHWHPRLSLAVSGIVAVVFLCFARVSRAFPGQGRRRRGGGGRDAADAEAARRSRGSGVLAAEAVRGWR